MRVCNTNGLIVYETIDELLKEKIVEISEFDDNYYVRLEPEFHFDNSIWKINKKTKKVSYMDYTEYILDICENVKVIDISELEKLK